MDIKKEFSRMQQHRWGTTGSIATVPVTDEMSINWLETDLNIGEIGINRTDDRAFFRTDNGIVEFATGTASSGVWIDTGVAIQLDASHTAKPVLPATDDTSDLGSSSLRWKDLYLGSRIDASTSMTFSVAGADVFTYENDRIILQSEKNIETSNGNGKLELDADADADTVRISNDGGDESDSYIKLESDLVSIVSQDLIELNGTLRLPSTVSGAATSFLAINASNDVVLASPGGFIISDTRANIIAARDAGTLTPGVRYHMTDKNIWLIALENDVLSTTGLYKRNIVSNTAYVVSGIIKGVWNSSLTVSIGDVVVWGAKTWENQTGSVGTATDDYTLDGVNWLPVLGYSEDKVFDVEYDIDLDLVIKMSDDRGNVLHITLSGGGTYVTEPSVSDWGDEKIKNNRSGYILNNAGVGIIQENYIRGRILNNVSNKGIYNNTNKGSIEENSNTGSIDNNSNTWDIDGNTNNGSISRNTNTGRILNNSNGASINENSNKGDIFTNSNTLAINANNNNGNIAGNTNLGNINQNLNDGNINNNSNDGNINNNSNDGSIDINSNTSSISGNRNLGSINNNSNDGEVSLNLNNGNIIGNSNDGRILANLNNGFILNNSHNGDISFNRCGNINNNSSSSTLTMDITSNRNNGSIEYNRNIANIVIQRNVNNGYIGNPSGPAISRPVNITDTVVNK